MAWLAGMRVTAQRLNDNSTLILDQAALTSNITGITTTNTAIVTGNNVTFRDGRAFRVTLRGLVTASGTANNGCRFRLYKGSVSGATIREWWDLPVFTATAGRNIAVDISTILSNTSGVDVSAAMVAAAVRDWGTDSITVSASAGTPTTLTVEEIGDAADVPFAQPIS